MLKSLFWFKPKKPAFVEQEKRLAKRTGGKRTKGSGAHVMHKGDINVNGEWLLEAKTTSKHSLSIKQAWLEKISDEACLRGIKPLVAIEFQDMKAGIDRDWILMPFSEYKELIS